MGEARLSRIFNLYFPAVADCISFTAPSLVVLFIDMIFAFFWPGWREEEDASAALRKAQGMRHAAEEERHKAAAPLTQSAAQPAKPRAVDPADEMQESRVVVPLRRAVKPTLSEVEALKQRRMSNRKIAALYGIDESTIRRVLKEPKDAASATDAAQIAG